MPILRRTCSDTFYVIDRSGRGRQNRIMGHSNLGKRNACSNSQGLTSKSISASPPGFDPVGIRRLHGQTHPIIPTSHSVLLHSGTPLLIEEPRRSPTLSPVLSTGPT